MEEQGLTVCNNPRTRTRPSSDTSPDVVAASSGVCVKSWALGTGNGSDHEVLVTDISWPNYLRDPALCWNEQERPGADSSVEEEADGQATKSKKRRMKRVKGNSPGGKRPRLVNNFKKANWAKFAEGMERFLSCAITMILLAGICSVANANRAAEESLPDRYPGWLVEKAKPLLQQAKSKKYRHLGYRGN